MAVLWNEKEKIFTLHTKNSTYQMKVDAYGFLLHLYYGKKVNQNMDYLLTYVDRGFSGNPYEAGKDRTYSMDILPLEYPTQGIGDYRSSALSVKNDDGSCACDLRYRGYRIKEGKYALRGLPALYDDEEKATTLEIDLEDKLTGVFATLLYGVFEENDIITRSLVIHNRGGALVTLKKVSSACLDFVTGDFDLIHFYGRHAMERNVERTPLSYGIQSIGSKRGTSSHQHNPFLIAAKKDATEDYGECYGLSFVYSGSFKGEAEKDPFGQTRFLLGLQDELFSYPLKPGETFYAPEAVLSFCAEGLTRLSQNYHEIYRHNLCRGKYKTARRPVLINNWEATYFHFDGERIYQIARQAKELGVEMLVLDDGWFGRRDDDCSGLGDWYVNEEKLGGSLKSLVERINGLSMKFGIWMEPEMVSEDSDLYRAHPDWAFAIPGRKPVRSRYQLVLDFSRGDVADYIFDQMCGVLDQANIEYLKWDMNRSITDVYSALAGKEEQGAVLYRYVLGVYDLLERLLARYPNLLIEGCSGGGGRFDAGMLYYTPQIWLSDNTDAIDRIRIHYGSSFGYPVSCMGSHVSKVPNEQTGRITPMETRGVVAMAGSFGYELDLNRISQEEKEMVKKQIITFKENYDLIHNGLYYRLSNPFSGEEFAAWEFVSRDQKTALLNVVSLESHGNPPSRYVKVKGLLKEGLYELSGVKQVIRGDALMSFGLPVPYEPGEYHSWQVTLRLIG